MPDDMGKAPETGGGDQHRPSRVSRPHGGSGGHRRASSFRPINRSPRPTCRLGWPTSLASPSAATAGKFPSSGEGRVDGHCFYFRERGGTGTSELDLRAARHQGVLIATGTITAPGYGQRAPGSGRRSSSPSSATICCTRGPPRPPPARTTATGSVVAGGQRVRGPGRRVPLAVPGWHPPRTRALQGIIKVVRQIAADDPDTGGRGLR